MKEKIETKIDEIIDYICSKNIKDVSYDDYKILESRINAIKYAEETEQRNAEMSAMLFKAFNLPKISKED